MKKVKYGCEEVSGFPSSGDRAMFWFSSNSRLKSYIQAASRAHTDVASGVEVCINEIISVDGQVYRHIDSPAAHFMWRPSLLREQGETWYTQYPAIVDVISGRVIVVELPRPDDRRMPSFEANCLYYLQEEGPDTSDRWLKVNRADPGLGCHFVVVPSDLGQLRTTKPPQYPKFPTRYKVPKFEADQP
jgi:hypothetical protein